jgi:glycosyltransferase involved in cell wall biosynthesis
MMRTPPVSVLHVHSGNLYGGVERILETLAAYTPPEAPMTSAFALCFSGRLADELGAAGAVVHLLGEVQIRRPDQVWRSRRALRAVLSRQSYDVAVVHSSWSQAIFGPTVKTAGTPLVRWFHAPDPGPAWLERWAERARPALALCNSRYTLDHARARLADIRAEVQYPPARWPIIADGEARSDVRTRLGTPADTVVIVMASRIEPLKGHRLLVDALTRVSASNWQVWIVGGAQRPEEMTYLSELQRTVASAGLDERVRFLGERTDIPSLMAAADIYCQPNTGPEAFGLSFVEALAAGLPVVTTRLGAAPEVVDPACGLLVQPGSPDALAVALSTLVGDGAARRRLGDAARRRAADFCDLPASFSALAHTLRTLTPSSAFSS